MKYLADIKRFIELMLASERFHLLTVMGAPGWAKTHGTRTTLQEMGVKYGLLGSYATPLALYNKLAEDPHQTLIIDDCAGVFSSPLSMSILNAAFWPSADAKRIGGSKPLGQLLAAGREARLGSRDVASCYFDTN